MEFSNNLQSLCGVLASWPAHMVQRPHGRALVPGSYHDQGGFLVNLSTFFLRQQYENCPRTFLLTTVGRQFFVAYITTLMQHHTLTIHLSLRDKDTKRASDASSRSYATPSTVKSSRHDIRGSSQTKRIIRKSYHGKQAPKRSEISVLGDQLSSKGL